MDHSVTSSSHPCRFNNLQRTQFNSGAGKREFNKHVFCGGGIPPAQFGSLLCPSRSKSQKDPQAKRMHLSKLKVSSLLLGF